METYPPEVRKWALALREIVLQEMPGALELIYDSYNALSIAYSPTDSLQQAFCHIALYSRHLNLGFNYGSALADPEKMLEGSGKYIRHIKIDDPKKLDKKLLGGYVRIAIDHNRRQFPDTEVPTVGRSILKSSTGNKHRPRG